MNRWAAVGMLPILCVACSGSFFQSKASPPTIYALSPAAASSDLAAAAAIPADLAVLKPEMRLRSRWLKRTVAIVIMTPSAGIATYLLLQEWTTKVQGSTRCVIYLSF